jgi:hypothetical protein
MGINFPSSPLVGDIWPNPVVTGQPQYTWDGEKWTSGTVNTVGAVRYDTPQTLTTDSGTTMGQRSQARANVYAAPFDALAYSGMQINGSMEVSQANGGAANPIGGFNLDGWGATASGGTVTVQQIPSGALAPGTWFNNSLAIIASTAVPSAAGTYAFLSQNIEGYRVARLGWGNTNSQPITIAFWVYSSVGGTMCVTVRNTSSSRTYTVDVSVTSASWQYKTVTIPGDTTGTWAKDNTAGLCLFFVFAAGSTYQTPAGVWTASTNYLASPNQTNLLGSNGAAMYITGVVVLPGIEAPSAARSPLIMRPYDQELLTCKRYWGKYRAHALGPSPASSSYLSTRVNFLAEMRSVPTTAIATVGTSTNVGSRTATQISTSGVTVYALTSVISTTAEFIDDITTDARL